MMLVYGTRNPCGATGIIPAKGLQDQFLLRGDVIQPWKSKLPAGRRTGAMIHTLPAESENGNNATSSSEKGQESAVRSPRRVRRTPRGTSCPAFSRHALR